MNFARICIHCMKEKASTGRFCPYCGNVNESYRPGPDVLPPFTRLNGKYILGKALGAGGFGITYIALDVNLQVAVAIKELFMRNISQRSRGNALYVDANNRECFEENKNYFMQEARALARINEKDNVGIGIVGVKDIFSENNTEYMVMEYLAGETLMAKVARRPMSYEAVKVLMSPICFSLMKIHQEKVLHLDVAPDNIMILPDYYAKLLDFGAAKYISGKKTENQQYTYKKGFAPLEQRSKYGRIGPWTDIYSTAATIYYCMTGRRPIDAKERAMGVVLERPSTLHVRMPRSAEDALMQALQVDPVRRYTNMAEFWRAFTEKKHWTLNSISLRNRK